MKKQLLLVSIFTVVLPTIVATQIVWGEAHVPVGKVQVCHKGKKTLSIHPDSLQDHLDHGDSEGACAN